MGVVLRVPLPVDERVVRGRTGTADTRQEDDLSLAKAKENWPRHFVRELVLPNYITNWCIWIPVMMAVYAFPLTLQIHLGGFAGAFWTLVFLYLGARRDELRGSRSSSS